MQKPRQIFTALICLIICLIFSSLFVCAYAQAQTFAPAPTEAATPISRVITASDYADFLNHVAASDPHHLYEEAMGSDPETACILRFGMPGNYFYEVIAGREDVPVRYANKSDEEEYCDWCENGALVSNEENCDGSLKSNQSGFEVDVSIASMLTLAVEPTASQSPSSSSWQSDVNGIVVVATAFALAGFGHQLMLGGDGVEEMGKAPDASGVGEQARSTIGLVAEARPDQQAVIVSRGVIEKLKTREIRRNHEALQSAQRMLADRKAEWSVWDGAAARWERANQDLQTSIDAHGAEVVKDDRMIVRVAALVPHTIAGAAKTDVDTCGAHLEAARAIAVRVNEALGGAETKAKAASDNFSIVHARTAEAESATQKVARQLEQERRRFDTLNKQLREAQLNLKKYRDQLAQQLVQAPALIATHTEAASAAEKEAADYDASAARKINPDKKHADEKKAEAARSRATESRRKAREFEAAVVSLNNKIRAAEESISTSKYDDQIRAAAIARYSLEVENARLRHLEACADEDRASELVKTTRAAADALKTAKAWKDIELSFDELAKKIMTTAPFDLEGAKAAHEAANDARNKQAYDQRQQNYSYNYDYGRNQQQASVNLTSTLASTVNLLIEACQNALAKATAKAEASRKAIDGQKYEFYSWASLSNALENVASRMSKPVDLTALRNARTAAQDELLRVIEFPMLKFHGDVGRKALQAIRAADAHVTDEASRLVAMMDSIISAKVAANIAYDHAEAEAIKNNRCDSPPYYYEPAITKQSVRDEIATTLRVIKEQIISDGDTGKKVARHINQARKQVATSATQAVVSFLEPMMKAQAAIQEEVNKSSNVENRSGYLENRSGYQWQDHLSDRYSYPARKNIPQLLADAATATEAARAAARTRAVAAPIVVPDNAENEAVISAWMRIRELMDSAKDRELREAEESVKAAEAALAEAEEVGDCIIN